MGLLPVLRGGHSRVLLAKGQVCAQMCRGGLCRLVAVVAAAVPSNVPCVRECVFSPFDRAYAHLRTRLPMHVSACTTARSCACGCMRGRAAKSTTGRALCCGCGQVQAQRHRDRTAGDEAARRAASVLSIAFSARRWGHEPRWIVCRGPLPPPSRRLPLCSPHHRPHLGTFMLPTVPRP